MDVFLEILKYILPSIVVAGVVYLIIDKFFQEERIKRELELKSTLLSNITPNKLQAYERMAIFLERINPTSLVRRINGYQNVNELEHAIIESIQNEYDHNLSQQIYINPQTWQIIFSAKNTTQNFINECAKRLPDNPTVHQFQEEIIRSMIKENSPTTHAMIYLQKDIQGNI